MTRAAMANAGSESDLLFTVVSEWSPQALVVLAPGEALDIQITGSCSHKPVYHARLPAHPRTATVNLRVRVEVDFFGDPPQ
jgi:hypothetical protein